MPGQFTGCPVHAKAKEDFVEALSGCQKGIRRANHCTCLADCR